MKTKKIIVGILVGIIALGIIFTLILPQSFYSTPTPQIPQPETAPRNDVADPTAINEKPIWYCVKIKFVKKFAIPVTLEQIKFDPKLNGIIAAKKGSRLSIQPVSEAHFNRIISMQ